MSGSEEISIQSGAVGILGLQAGEDVKGMRHYTTEQLSAVMRERRDPPLLRGT